jgi:hypothetical protein
MKPRTDREILLKQLVDKQVAMTGDVTLDDTNIALTATKTTAIATSTATSATQNTAIATSAATSATQNTNTAGSVATVATRTDSLDKLSFGKHGFLVHTSGAVEPEAGTYYAAQFINETELGAFAATNCSGTMATTYPAGTVIYADVTQMEIASGGPVILYKAG